MLSLRQVSEDQATEDISLDFLAVGPVMLQSLLN